MTDTLTRSEVVDLLKRGRRARDRGRTIKRIVVSLISSAVTSLIGGWELMLAVGIAHSAWLPALPTIGYWWACLIVLLLRGTFSAGKPSSKTEAAL